MAVKKKSFIFFFLTSKVKVGAAIIDYTVGLLLHLYTAQLPKGVSYTVNSGLCWRMHVATTSLQGPLRCAEWLLSLNDLARTQHLPPRQFHHHMFKPSPQMWYECLGPTRPVFRFNVYSMLKPHVPCVRRTGQMEQIFFGRRLLRCWNDLWRFDPLTTWQIWEREMAKSGACSFFITLSKKLTSHSIAGVCM